MPVNDTPLSICYRRPKCYVHFVIQDAAEFGRLQQEVAHATCLTEDLVIEEIIDAEEAGDISEAQANELHGALFLRLYESRQHFLSSLNEYRG